MKPIIYAYQEQINDLFKQKQETPFKGMAFGWNEENVFHLYTSLPKVAPSGVPCLAVIRFVSEADFDKVEDMIEQTFEEVGFRNLTNSKKIAVFYSLKNNELQNKTFLINENGTQSCTLKYVPQKSELYSRSKGLLEVAILEQKRVAIIGLGSFGSLIAVELAKAGLGKFNLYDFDRVELSNIARHMCGINDLGRYKTLAVKDIIHTKNPYAEVTTFEIDINEEYVAFKNSLQNVDLIICVTDENRSRYNINKFAIDLKKTTIFSRAITRAEGGDVYRFRPTQSASPCLGCLIGSGFFDFKNEEVSTVSQAERDAPDYVPQDEINATVQVGLSSDIAPICNMVVKLALVELSKGLVSGITSLEQDFIADYYIWVNRRERAYSSWQPMEYFANRPSVMRWYGVEAKKSAKCGQDCIIANPKLILND
ncbi:MAG: ThiF family adenylyltransferase [Saprospiraceae bacterium]